MLAAVGCPVEAMAPVTSGRVLGVAGWVIGRYTVVLSDENGDELATQIVDKLVREDLF